MDWESKVEDAESLGSLPCWTQSQEASWSRSWRCKNAAGSCGGRPSNTLAAVSQAEAGAAGGRLITLLGNHELMNLG